MCIYIKYFVNESKTVIMIEKINCPITALKDTDFSLKWIYIDWRIDIPHTLVNMEALGITVLGYARLLFWPSINTQSCISPAIIVHVCEVTMVLKL